MSKHSVGMALVVAVLAAATVAIAGGDWSAAKSSAERFKSEVDDLRSLTPKETKTIVKAICDAEEEERRSEGAAAASRVKDTVASKYETLKSMKSDAVRALEDVLADEELKDHHSDASSLKDDVERRFETITRMTHAIRGANHPVVNYLLEEGTAAHRRYQDGSGLVRCHAREFSTGNGFADCINADQCLVVELKPNNSRAISRGKGQASGYASALNASKELRESLAKVNSDFAKCVDQTFQHRVDCYTLCPDIDGETNEMLSATATWDDDC